MSALETPKVIPGAISYVAQDLHIGCLDIAVSIPKHGLLPRGEERKEHLYISENGYSDAARYVYRIKTGDGGFGSFTFLGESGRKEPFTDAEIQDLEVIAQVIQIHFARFRLGMLMEEAPLTQYLTGLPNSGGYLRRVGELFAQGKLKQYDAYYLNIRGMSLFNVKYGQSEGDQIIRRYADKLNSFLCQGELLGHLGGDSFTALIFKENTIAWEQFIKSVDVFAMRDNERIPIKVGATVGVMRLDDSLPGPWMVISGPSIALYEARKMSSGIMVLTHDMQKKAGWIRRVENNFHRAILGHRFVPYFQPKVNILTGELVGAEVLARWMDKGDVIEPGDFIPILERTGEILELDLYMLDITCQMIRTWKDATGRSIPLSVNMSRRDLRKPDLAETVIGVMDRYGLDHGDVIIEVTETENARESQAMMEFLNKLTAAGVKTSIDDFGTGYSSLSFLRDYPVSEIKIDRSFINHESFRERDRIILGSIIDMAGRLGIEVITEGVETHDQVDFLLGLNCHRAQGFLYDRPLDKETFSERMSKGIYDTASAKENKEN